MRKNNTHKRVDIEERFWLRPFICNLVAITLDSGGTLECRCKDGKLVGNFVEVLGLLQPFLPRQIPDDPAMILSEFNRALDQWAQGRV